MKLWSLILVVSLAFVASCKKQDCPVCPKAADCPAAAVDAAPGEVTVEFAFVEHESGTKALVGIKDGKAIVIPVDNGKARVIVDGKASTLGEALLFGPGGGGCPCTQPRCWEWCRPAGGTLSNPDLMTGSGGGTAPLPTEPVPGGGSATGATQPAPN